MDKGRQIDNAQNVNARFIDNFGQGGKTSVNVSNPPGKEIYLLFRRKKLVLFRMGSTRSQAQEEGCD